MDLKLNKDCYAEIDLASPKIHEIPKQACLPARQVRDNYTYNAEFYKW